MSTKLERPKPAVVKKPEHRTLGPVSDLERHLPSDWWRTLFNSIYLKTDGDVVEHDANTAKEIDLLLTAAGLQPEDKILDLCCGQGRHTLELADRGFKQLIGIDRSRYLIRLARKRAKQRNVVISFSEGDARKIRLPESSLDCVMVMGNSFGYFEKIEEDIAVLESIKRVLKSRGKLVLDITDGAWMREHFEPRSWEWIDQNHFVCRERSLSADSTRIVSREVVVNAELGVIADQFYGERLYTFNEISALLESLGFGDITTHSHIQADSTRGQDLGMMANRIFLTAEGPIKQLKTSSKTEVIPVSVLLGDPKLPDEIKNASKFNKEDFEALEEMKKALKKLTGFQFSYYDNHLQLMQELIHNPPEFVFNLCDEGFLNQGELELHLPALLDMLNIPYSGAAPACLASCYNKSLVRAVAANLEIPVPLESYFDPMDQAASIPSIFPALLKPNFGDGSVGITEHAVVHDAAQLINYLDTLRETLTGIPILVQEYLPGREFSVGLIGNPGQFEVLPILEVDYSELPPELPRILGYESKWIPESAYWQKIKYVEAHLEDEAKRQLIDYSTLLAERLACRDYARFDFRMDSNGVIKLLEVNPNPAWCWDGKLNLMAGFRGMAYHELLEMILKVAMDRYRNSHD